MQIGAVAAVVIYFWSDLWGIVRRSARGLADSERRRDREFRFGLAVAVGSIPIAIAGLALRHVIEGPLRSLWVVGVALIAWSFAMLYADLNGTQRRTEADFNMRDAIVMGLTQCLALIPGVSRSGATITAGLFQGLDRVTVIRMSFFLAIPALTAAALLEAVTKSSDISGAGGVGWGPTWSRSWSVSSSRTQRSPGCSATSPGTTSRSSSCTGSRSGSWSWAWSRRA